MKSNKFYEILKSSSETLEKFFIDMLSIYLKSQYGGWFLGKVIDIAINQLDEKIIDPIMDILVIRVAKKYDERKSNELISKIRKARENKDEDAYNQHVDDLYGGV